MSVRAEFQGATGPARYHTVRQTNRKDVDITTYHHM